MSVLETPLKLSFGEHLGELSMCVIGGRISFSPLNLPADLITRIQIHDEPQKSVAFVRLFNDGAFIIRDVKGYMWNGRNAIVKSCWDELKKPGDIDDLAIAGNKEWVVIRPNSFAASSAVDENLKKHLSEFYATQRQRKLLRTREIQEFLELERFQQMHAQEVQMRAQREAAERMTKDEAEHAAREASERTAREKVERVAREVAEKVVREEEESAARELEENRGKRVAELEHEKGLLKAEEESLEEHLGSDPESTLEEKIEKEREIIAKEAKTIEELEKFLEMKKESLETRKSSLKAYVDSLGLEDEGEHTASQGVEEEKAVCSICLVEYPVKAVDPCGHLCLCDECGSLIESGESQLANGCPTCRIPIQKILRIYGL